jgi:hypothetical protein
MTVTLPHTFAIYRPDMDQFQLIQPEYNSEGKVQRLKNWARPDKETWNKSTEEERTAILPWFRGEEWYVVPTSSAGSQDTPKIFGTEIHGDKYAWWFLRHKLVWSNYMTHHNRRNIMAEDWKTSPSIPIIEFNTKLIYPRTNTGFYGRWCDCVPNALIVESKRAAAEFQKPECEAKEATFDPRDLRIRTPPPRDDDEESETDTEELVQRAPRWRNPQELPPIGWARIAGLIATTSIITLVACMYVFILAQAFGV